MKGNGNMSSVNFEKIKQNGKPVSSYLRHNDTKERLKHEHQNKDINKELTPNNLDWNGIDYQKAKSRFNSRISELDETPGQNKRKDRVVAFALCLTVPKDVKDKVGFFNDVMKLFEKNFGKENIVQANLHCDEVHEYLENGTVKTSLEHIHCVVIPEINGILNGKKFSSKSAMSGINKTIDQMCREKYGCQFMTRETPKHKTVEELKAEGEAEKKALVMLADKEPVTPKRKGLNDVVMSKKDFEKLSLKASEYEHIDSKSREIAESSKELSDKLNALKKETDEHTEVISKARKVQKIADSLPLIQRKERELKEEIEYAKEELSSLIEQKERYGDSLDNQIKFAKMELENQNLKAENKRFKNLLSNIRQSINQEIKAFERYNSNPFVERILKSLKKIAKSTQITETDKIRETER